MLLFLTVLGTVLALIGQLNWHFFKQVLFDHELHFALMLSLGTSLFSLVVAFANCITCRLGDEPNSPAATKAN